MSMRRSGEGEMMYIIRHPSYRLKSIQVINERGCAEGRRTEATQGQQGPLVAAHSNPIYRLVELRKARTRLSQQECEREYAQEFVHREGRRRRCQRGVPVARRPNRPESS